MILIIGGAYQGKSEYAKEKYGGSICSCTDSRIDTSFDIIEHLEIFSLSCVKMSLNPRDEIKKYADELKDKILICDDISQGVVPMDKTLRVWREENGRMLSDLSKRADKVIRIFCGLPQVIKDYPTEINLMHTPREILP